MIGKGLVLLGCMNGYDRPRHSRDFRRGSGNGSLVSFHQRNCARPVRQDRECSGDIRGQIVGKRLCNHAPVPGRKDGSHLFEQSIPALRLHQHLTTGMQAVKITFPDGSGERVFQPNSGGGGVVAGFCRAADFALFFQPVREIMDG